MKIFVFWKSIHQSCDFCVNFPFDFSLKKNLPNPGIELESLTSSALEEGLFSTSAPLGNHMYIYEVKVTQSCPTHTYIHIYIYIYKYIYIHTNLLDLNFTQLKENCALFSTFHQIGPLLHIYDLSELMCVVTVHLFSVMSFIIL